MKPPPQTLIEMMARRARLTPEKTAFTFDGQAVSFSDLWTRINRLGRRLAELGLGPGDRGVIVIPNGPDFFEAFYGLLLTGAAAVPLFPGSGPERVATIARLARAKAVIVPSGAPEKNLTQLRAALGNDIPVVRAGESASDRGEITFPQVRRHDPALIQYTSGSTGNPKGVVISHANLLTNLDQMITGMAITDQDIFVSWLPVYHDMGLILMTMAPFRLAAELHLLPTDLKDTRSWLEAIHAHRGTFTAAPDFAYRLCLKHASTPGEFDLTSLRVALNAAELVRPKTIRDFEAAFGLENVMAPGYGLAEATVGVSMWPPGTKPAIDERGFASVGPPFPGVKVRIAAEGQALPPGEVGQVMVKSPANSGGYLDNPAETAKLFVGDGFLATGDLGYLDASGNLFIVGRLKTIIIRAGETISPKEIEEIADDRPEVRFSAAVGVDRGRAEGEQVYIFAEVRDPEGQTSAAMDRLVREMVHRFRARLGFRPARVYLVRPRSIPLTHNGKIQYARLRDDYLSGRLRRAGAIAFPDF